MGFGNAGGVRLNGCSGRACARKSQFSTEFLVLLAALLAFFALFAGVASGALEKSVLLSKETAAGQKLAGACAYIRLFSLDGLHAVSGKAFQGFSSDGKRLVFGNHSLECDASFRFEGGVLKVKAMALEVR